MPPARKIELGTVFGRLRIIAEDMPRKRPRFFICQCSCGKQKSIRFYDLLYGKVKSCGCLHAERLRDDHLSEKNAMWKGEKVGYNALHSWVRRRKKKPKFCIRCKKRKALDLANISQNYTRDLNDWEYLCRKCHIIGDGRISNLKHQYGR